MYEFKGHLEKLAEDVVELKVSSKETEVTLKHNTQVLERLTDSVEEHVARSNRLEDLMGLVRAEVKLSEKKVDNHIKVVTLIAKVIFYTLAGVGSTILGLYQMGILSKLF
jgi:hypothetical protein